MGEGSSFEREGTTYTSPDIVHGDDLVVYLRITTLCGLASKARLGAV